jgi:hypothetical protein
MVPSNQPFTLHSIFEKDKLNGTNYADWIRNLRIVLRAEKKEEILDKLLEMLMIYVISEFGVVKHMETLPSIMLQLSHQASLTDF